MLRKSLSIITVLFLVSVCVFAAQKLTPETFTVGPGKQRTFCFRASSETNRITGRWRAEGGSKNDIHVIFIDNEELENFQNGNRVPTYYNRTATTGTIDLNLKAGEYCLIFDNGMSVVSNKAITSDITGY